MLVVILWRIKLGMEAAAAWKPALSVHRAASIAWLEGVAPVAQLATPELRANVLAAYVAGGRAREVPAVMAAMKFGPRDSFEIAFNAACALLGAGDTPAAEQQLLLAQRLGARPRGLSLPVAGVCVLSHAGLRVDMLRENPLSSSTCPCWQSAYLWT